MGRKIIERIMQSMRQVRAYVGSPEPATRRMHYFSMNPADGKMVRKTVSYSRGKRKKSR